MGINDWRIDGAAIPAIRTQGIVRDAERVRKQRHHFGYHVSGKHHLKDDPARCRRHIGTAETVIIGVFHGLNLGKLMITISIALFLAFNGATGELFAQDDPVKTVQPADSLNQPLDENHPEALPPTGVQQNLPQGAILENSADKPFSAHKANYFSINQWAWNKTAQLKFQISMKFRLLQSNLYVFKYNIFPAYFSYTQKSLWNIGRESMPFEESNYDPELFLDYPVNVSLLGRFKLHSFVICPIEHESNGLAGSQSQSWNRQYILIRFGIESEGKLKYTNSFLSNIAGFYIKYWHASDYSDQDVNLQLTGSDQKFLDYMGQGEIGISLRNFLWGGSLKDHQLDIRTPIFRPIRNHSYEFVFRQQIPDLNFAIYLQYWYGYGESLLRFDKFGHRGFVGFTFSY